MSSKRETFEFHVLRAKNWNVQNLYDTEDAAQAAARQALKSAQVEGVRILRIWKRADGEETEKIIFEQLCEVKVVRDVRITPIDEANYCETEADLLSVEGVRTTGLLFRKYLDEMQLTPLEIMHIHREYKRLWDTENVLVCGVDRIALIQTRDTERSNKERTDELYRIVEAVGSRASRFGTDKFVPKRVENTMSALLGEASENYYEAEDQRFFVNVVLARDLREQTSLMGKLDRIGELLDAEMASGTNDVAISYLDQAAAQIFASPQVFQDALGPKPNLAKALLTLVDLIEGGDAQFDRMLPHGELYLELLRSGKLPHVQAELAGRLVAMAGGTAPLSRNEPSNESVEFGKVANRLISGRRVLGGEKVALALLARACQFVVEGGAIGRKKALEWLLRVLKTIPQRVVVLKSLDTPFRKEPDMRIASFGHLRSIICTARSSITFTVSEQDQGGDIVAPMRAVTELYNWLEKEYPPKPIQPLQEHLDKLVAKYIEEKAIIEQMDRSDLKMADRATVLLNFVMSDALTKGKAMEMARTRVQEHLKRPDFVTEFVQGFEDPKIQEKKLREFHGLLSKAGFSLTG